MRYVCISYVASGVGYMTYRSRISHGSQCEKRHIGEAQERYKHGLKPQRSIAKG